MKLVEVIPISRGISKEVLSYFTTEEIPLGSLVEVDLRKRKIKGLVVSSKDATEARSEIRSADFALKKIEKVNFDFFLSPAFIKTAQKSAEYFAGTTGAVLNAVLPKTILDSPEVVMDEARLRRASSNSRNSKAEIDIIQDSKEDRFRTYRSIVRESFARHKSVFIVVPTHEDGLELTSLLEKGIENHTFFLSSAVPKKKLLDLIKKLRSDEHPILIIATGQFLFLAPENTKTIIVERESSSAYRLPARPFVDLRYFAESFARESDMEFILSDQYLRIETLNRYDRGEVVEKSPLKFRPESPSVTEVIDMKKYRKSSGASFQVLSDELISVIGEMQKRKQKMFIFSARRGLSPTTLCQDCGTIVTCHTCGAPTVLHKSKQDEKENFFLCHHCGEKRSALERCSNCGGWRLTSIGVGIEKVEEELKEKFGELPVFRLDKEVASTDKRARDIMKKFQKAESGILLGTEMVFLNLREAIDYIAIASMDSIFSLPDFHINERIFHILLSLKELSQIKFIIQTRDPEQSALKKFSDSRFSEFYREELKEREKFGYPPFKTIIKISVEGTRSGLSRDMQKIETIFKDYEPSVFPAFVGGRKGNLALNALIKIDSRNWPASTSDSSLGGSNEDLLQKLLSLPPNWTIKVNPESLM